MKKHQDVVLPFREEMILEIQSAQASQRAEVIRQLGRVNLAAEEAEQLFPFVIALFSKEPTKTRKKQLASLIVNCVTEVTGIPGLIECLDLALKEAKTRNDTFCAFNDLKRAAWMGWDLTPAIPTLIGHCLTDWRVYALEALRRAAYNGIDVLSFDTPDGMQAWEVFRLILELNKSVDVREGVIRVLTEVMQHSTEYLDMFLWHIQKATQEEKMCVSFKEASASCLAVMQKALGQNENMEAPR